LIPISRAARQHARDRVAVDRPVLAGDDLDRRRAADARAATATATATE
jgi:hypothetical protein